MGKKVYLIKKHLSDNSSLIKDCFSPKSVVLQKITYNLNSKSLLMPIKIKKMSATCILCYTSDERKDGYDGTGLLGLAANPLLTQVENSAGGVGLLTL